MNYSFPNNSQDFSPNNSQSSASTSARNPTEIISEFIAGWITNHNTEPSDVDTQALRADEDLKKRITSLRFDLIIFSESVASILSKLMESMEDEEFRAYKQQMTSWFDDGNAWHQNADDLLQSQVSKTQEAILMEFKELHSENSKLKLDVNVKVRGISFDLNRERLASKSAYFALRNNERNFIFAYKLKPGSFLELFRYVFISKVEVVNLSRIFNLVTVADKFQVIGMKKILLRFIRGKELFVKAVQAWDTFKLSQSSLALFCHENYGDRFVDILPDYYMHRRLYESDIFGPNITESEIFCGLMQWCRSNCEFFEIEEMFDWVMVTLLQCIRWSAVPWKDVRDWTRDNRNFIAPLFRVSRFFSSILPLYYNHGIHYPMLRTFIRPSQGFERCLITVGGVDNSEIKVVGLQSPGCPEYISSNESKVPWYTKIHESVSGQLLHDPKHGSKQGLWAGLFLTGMGNNYNEIWRYTILLSWLQYPNLAVPRKFHSSVFVGSFLFSCGGLTGDNFDIVTDSVECYNTGRDVVSKSKRRGRLACPVYQAAGVTHRNTIYLLFKRRSYNTTPSIVQFVQAYDTAIDQCSVYNCPPCLTSLSEFMVPTVCGGLIIFLGEKDCFLFNTNLEMKLFAEYKTNVKQFAALVEDDSIFLFARPHAGCERGTILRNRFTGTPSDVPTDWETYGTMPFYSNFLVYGIASLPIR